VRTELADLFTAHLPDGYRVVGYPSEPDQIDTGSRVVALWQTDLVPGPTLGLVTCHLQVWVLTPHAKPAAADDDLDDALLDVLGVLAAISSQWVWTTATRDVMADTWHAYRVDVTTFGRLTGEDD
jgi:hypothetical protein